MHTSLIVLLIWQLVYYYIICYYIKIRIRAINERIADRSKCGIRKMISILRMFDSIYKEINAYNYEYWSKFLFLIWIIITIIISTLLSITMFVEMVFIIELCFLSTAMAFILFLILIINT